MSSVTKSKNLRSGTAVWTNYPVPSIPFSGLTKDQECDVVIIGAGISGAMVAEELTDAGFSVIILDKRGPLKGSTAASTAHLMYEIDNPVSKLKKQIGLDGAIRTWRRSKLGLDSLIEKIRMLDIDCSLKERQSLYIAGTDLDDDALRKESELRSNVGFINQYLNKRQVNERFNIKGRAAILSAEDAEINPVQLAAGLLLKALERKARIYSPVDVTEVESGAKQVRVHTKSGQTVKARHVIFATGYELPKYIKLKQHVMNSTWVFATKRQKLLWPERPLIWEASTPYLYIRTTSDRRIICGGEDEEFSDEVKRDALTEEKVRIMQKKLHKLYPDLDVEAEYTWAGTFGASTTGLPTIGEIPKMQNCYAVLGYGGNGITFSRIAAELIRARLVGIDDPDHKLFDF